MLYLKDASYIDWRSLELRRGCIEVAPGTKGGIRHVPRPPGGGRVLACGGRLVTRSFAVAHHHAYSALARGGPAPRRRPRDFQEILKRVWWSLDRKLDAEMIRVSALATAIEALRCGVTFVIDHHSSPNAAEGSLDIIAEAFDRVGVGHLLCLELSDRDGPTRLKRGLAETRRHLCRRQGLVGLHASFTVSDALLEKAAGLMQRFQTGVHVHAAEDLGDQKACRRDHGTWVIERFARAELLDSPRTLLAHCVHLSPGERDILRRGPAWVVQNAESNLNNAVGRFDPRGLGDRILLGTDGMHSDALASCKAAFLAGAETGGLSPLEAYRRLRRVHGYLAQGRFEGDGENNLVVLDYDPPTPVTSGNWPGHVVYGLGRAHVRSVVSQGRLVLDGGRVLTIDEAGLFREARAQARRLWRRL